ncbi:hypothetical protein SV7mr_22140 [Stieleria bergensis]|uniref:Uncharacterized protein n=1 Tax=Stieleria bergensis TaxID=2528025 RepID=A0A517SU98_9BACT|nr:hypothetical protein SV7mr_22140 [Planctomycetes bacterium SV_7m_r]
MQVLTGHSVGGKESTAPCRANAVELSLPVHYAPSSIRWQLAVNSAKTNCTDSRMLSVHSITGDRSRLPMLIKPLLELFLDGFTGRLRAPRFQKSVCPLRAWHARAKPCAPKQSPVHPNKALCTQTKPCAPKQSPVQPNKALAANRQWPATMMKRMPSELKKAFGMPLRFV